MYSKAKIYKIVDSSYNECYYGSTIQSLSKRMGHHREKYHKYKDGKFSFITCFKLFDKYGLENCKIELVENYECKSKEELHKREGWYIKNNQCVNKFIPGRTGEEYREDNKDKIIESKKKHYEDNKDKIKQRSNKRYQEYKDDIKEKVKIYRDNIKEFLLEKVNCECGGKYANKHKTTHFKTQKHQKFMQSK